MAQIMSAKDNACRKFQANIFNKSKCQNCFKARDAHLLTDEDVTQAKPIYGGWLLLAPEGTHFDNPLHRSRKWQRRFFLLYEHGLLRYALDEMASTLPQGTINLNQCVDVVDGESRTGQKHSLCICIPDQDHYIRAESKEVIHGWQEALIVFPRTNKQNQKKKRKVETPTPQDTALLTGRGSQQNMNGCIEPGPAKVTVTSTSSSDSSGMVCLPSTIAHAERVPPTRASLWQEETWSRAAVATSCSATNLSQHSEVSRSLSVGRTPRVESGYFSLENNKPKEDEGRQHEQEPEPPQQLPTLFSASSSRFRYLSFDPEHFSSPVNTSQTTQTPHTAANTQTAKPPNASANKRNTHSDNTQRPEEHLSPETHTHDYMDATSLDFKPSSDTKLAHTRLHANILPSSLSSSRSSLNSEVSPQNCGSMPGVGGASGRAGRGGQSYAALADVPRARRLSHREAFRSNHWRPELRACTKSPGREEVERLFGLDRRRSQFIERFEGHDTVDTPEQMDTTNSSAEPAPSISRTANQRAGRNERRLSNQKQEFSLDSSKDRTDAVSSQSGYRRAKSLDRRATETLMTPDLLNFKKGWMTKLYEDGLWKKHWFVLTDQSLRFYRDSIAEEASDLDGEIDLSICYDVTEFPVQRNYGFQILSKEGAFTLSAMTSGIRRNWIQAILKNMRPTVAPDVTRSLPEEQSRSNVEQKFIQPSPNSLQLSNSSGGEAKRSHENITDPISPPEQRKSLFKREGRSKTFDWAEFHPGQENESNRPSRKRADTSVITSTSSPSSISSAASSPISSSSSHLTSSSITINSHTDKLPQQDEEELVQNTMCQEHHLQTTPTSTTSEPPSKLPYKVPQEQVRIDGDQPRDMQVVDGHQVARRNSDVQVEIEQRWQQVETTPLREEKQVPITGSSAPNTSNAPVGERLHPQELTTILEKELGQAQRELARLQQQNSVLQEQLQDFHGRELNAREGYILQATCERGFAAMEETHQKVIEDIQRQHQREIRKLLEEKERLLEEETNATIAAIEAMKNAHREELEKSQRAQMSGVSPDIQELRRQYEEELQSIYRELEVLSEQYSQKCLENAHLTQALEAERQALGQCQRENNKLHTHNQELNHRLNEEITRMRSCASGDKAAYSLTQGKDIYELEVLLRVKESEIQYLKQEINSLKDELQSAFRDKKYASDKYKDIYTELSIVKAKADCDIIKLREKLLAATEALGELDTEGGAVTAGYDIMKSKSNPDFLKKEKSRQLRGVRSKSLKEGLTVQERMKLFESKDSRKI
ncbi:myosin phosphatase Rho-interacting protein-like isoform X2 [Xyrauchen texanus]|uniref:myosin phosphatase Rho-interacting protein-like isoform X2 n=1 Tax=Xyrauchen texanus TaxID=154827 RepID=UPI0022423D3B|nr:myosin phosphatase Rho-interacting protein-like isoform X2 [Xyrauchen texanus]